MIDRSRFIAGSSRVAGIAAGAVGKLPAHGVAKRVKHIARLTAVNVVAMAYLTPKSTRVQIMRACGYRLGAVEMFSGSIIRADVLEIGDGSFINHRCLFDRGQITIGTNVFISSGVTLASGDHVAGTSAQRAGDHFTAPIRIGDGCWIGANVTVLSGVTIASGCIIGAGAVVTKSTDPDGVYAGVPARRIRDLNITD